jgi:hypothetical protein
MHELLAGAILAHTAVQNAFELLALMGPFAIVFGAGALLIIGPIVKHQGDRYQHQPIRGDEKPAHTNGSTKPSRAAASPVHTEEDQVAASSGSTTGEDT